MKRPERGARFVVKRDPETGGRWTWVRWSNGRIVAQDTGGVVDLRQALRNIESLTGGTITPNVRGPRRRLVEGFISRGDYVVRVSVVWAGAAGIRAR